MNREIQKQADHILGQLRKMRVDAHDNFTVPRDLKQVTIIVENFNAMITRIYNIEEKIMYLYEYFEHHLTHTALSIEEQEQLRFRRREIDFKNIINETTTLKDIQENVKLFIQREYYRDMLIAMEDLIVRIETLTSNKFFTNPWYKLVRNSTVVGVISVASLKTITYYTACISVLKQMLTDPYAVQFIGRNATAAIFSKGPVRMYWYDVSSNLPYLRSFLDLIFIGNSSDVIHGILVLIISGFIIWTVSPENQDRYVEAESTMPFANTYLYSFAGIWLIVILILLYKMIRTFTKHVQKKNNSINEHDHSE
jgi:hypothetical protein